MPNNDEVLNDSERVEELNKLWEELNEDKPEEQHEPQKVAINRYRNNEL